MTKLREKVDMFTTMLIANRGEIALRVARACRELGVGVVAVYSTADKDSPVVRMADKSIHIGPPPPKKSYLHIPNIIEAALCTGADAIHPGYGLLSEDPDFAEICAKEGITFVGPRPEVMHQLGNKAAARALMADAGLPLLPGAVEPIGTAEEGEAVAIEIGNAEDPTRGFAPTSGILDVFDLPAGPWTRVDSGYLPGAQVTPDYDSLLAKLIVWAPDRKQALTRMDRALGEFRVEGRGIATTIGFHRSILRHPVFRAGKHSIHFVDQLITEPAGQEEVHQW
jgi:acetyl/propionyl-CoA carboxylase alpha subunit